MTSPSTDTNFQRSSTEGERKCGFDLMSRAFCSPNVKTEPKKTGCDFAASTYWVEQTAPESGSGRSSFSGFDLLEEAQKGVFDGEATEEGLRQASAGFEVREKSGASCPVNNKDGFGLLDSIWQHASQPVPAKSTQYFAMEE